LRSTTVEIHTTIAKMTKRQKLLTAFALLSTFLLTAKTRAQSPVVVRIDPHADGPSIPDDFCGLSFESSNLLPDRQGKYLFSRDNADLVALFRVIGIKNLRVGGGTADMPQYRIPAHADIDHLFAFAKAADVKIIYTLRLLNGSPKDAAETARYIMQRYASRLVCFEIGNEPDWHSYHTSPGHAVDPKIIETAPDTPGSAFPSYLATWNDFASTITKFAPDAKFTGPDTGSNHPVPGTKNTDYGDQSWTLHFARAQKESGKLLFVAQHDYVGQDAKGVSPETAIAAMLSRDWVQTRYPLLFDHVLAPVQKLGLSYRMTEANDYTGGVDGASNAYASALWALDYLHWHAARHALGVNFHNKRWIFTDTLLPDRTGRFHFTPKAYAIRAFELGAHGTPLPVTVENANNINLTAYAVRDSNTLLVTLINKEYGPTAKSAAVTLRCSGITGRAASITLQSPHADVTAKEGITLGGASISPSGWTAQWSPQAPCEDDRTQLTIAPASATIVRLDIK
jgi:hypothetical protein